jgi:hypothetical protein
MLKYWYKSLDFLIAATSLSTLLVVFPDGLHANANSIANVTLSPPIAFDMEGNNLIQALEGEQIVLSITVFNNMPRQQSYVALLEVRDESGITEYLAWSSNVIQFESNKTMGISFIPTKQASYSIRAFAISDLEQPMVLSSVAVSELRVGNEKLIEQAMVFEDYPLPTVEVLRNYTKSDAKEIQEEVCIDTAELFDTDSLAENDANASRWLPQQLTFDHLVPKQTVYRIGCSIDSYGIYYAHFIMHNNFIMHDSLPAFLQSNKLLFPPIASEEQALEYVAYFGLAHEGRDTRIIIPSEEEFASATLGCNIERNPSSKVIRVTEKSGFFVTELNVYDWAMGGIFHNDWIVPISPDGSVYPTNAFKIGQCYLSN